jgi:hypothetical protein
MLAAARHADARILAEVNKLFWMITFVVVVQTIEIVHPPINVSLPLMIRTPFAVPSRKRRAPVLQQPLPSRALVQHLLIWLVSALNTAPLTATAKGISSAVAAAHLSALIQYWNDKLFSSIKIQPESMVSDLSIF